MVAEGDQGRRGSWARRAWRPPPRTATSPTSPTRPRGSSTPKRSTSTSPPTTPSTARNSRRSPTPTSPSSATCPATSSAAPSSLERYGLIYAGAQKNVGPAGVTVVLVRDDFLQRRNGGLPTMLDYGTHAAKLFNTPPVFAVYMVEKVLKWLEERGGLEWIAKRNEEKAKTLYARLDRTDFYRGTVEKEDRSKMNVCFRLPSEELGGEVCRRGEGGRPARAQGAPLRRRRAGLHLQRLPARGRGRPHRVHGRVRAAIRVRRRRGGG